MLTDQHANRSIRPLLTNLAQLLLAPLLALALLAALDSPASSPVRFQGDFSTQSGDNGVRVVIYTTRDCPATREALAFLASRGVSYEERALGANPTRSPEGTPPGCDSGPILLIGDTLIHGFQPRLIEQQLAGE